MLSKSQLKEDPKFPIQSISQIKWEKADVFDPSSYSDILKDADAVVHSMGIISPNTKYKNIINASINSFSDVPKLVGQATCDLIAKPLFSSLFPSSGLQNPLKKTLPQESQDQLFDKINRDSAVMLAKEFARVKGETDSSGKLYPFVYISAENYNKFLPTEYIESKRAAEQLISQIPRLRPVFLRPGFMINSSSQAPSSTIRGIIGNTMILRNNLAKVFKVEECVGASPVLSVQTVAKATVEALEDPTLSGPISLGALYKYSIEF